VTIHCVLEVFLLMNELFLEENVAIVLKAVAVKRQCQLSRVISIVLCLI